MYNYHMINKGAAIMRYAIDFIYYSYYDHETLVRQDIAERVAPFGGVVVDFIAEGDSGGNPEAVIAFDSLDNLRAYAAYHYDNDADDIEDTMKYAKII